MMKKVMLAAVAVFVAWVAMDFVIHVLILGKAYAATAHLWRPEGEMKMGVMWVTIFITAFCFVYIYAQFVAEKSMKIAMQYALLFGVAVAVGFAYGTYSVMPIPYSMALIWFLGSVTEAAVGGAIVGLIIKE